MERTLKLSLEKARELYGKNPEMDALLLANFTKDELHPYYKVGDRFLHRLYGGEYILARVHINTVTLISLVDGNKYDMNVFFEDLNKIPRSHKMFNDFSKIEK